MLRAASAQVDATGMERGDPQSPKDPLMTAAELKMVGLTWLRYARQMPYVATEVGRWKADVLGADRERAVEIEVKVTPKDLAREFADKRNKHMAYAGNGDQRWTPSKFYFFVPMELAPTAVRIAEERAPRYGVAAVSTRPGNPRNPFERVLVVRQAKPLHREAPSADLLDEIAARAASEVCRFHIKTFLPAAAA